MRYKRINTLAMDVSGLPAFPNHHDIQSALKVLTLDPTRIKSLQIHSSRKIIYVGLPDDKSAAAIAEKYKKGLGVGSIHFVIKISYVDEDIVDVRVRDLPPETPNNIIEKSLRKYGDVHSVTSEVWKDFYPGALTGVRVARMKVTTNIPSFITIGNSVALVKYPGQIETCRKCSAPLHKNFPCKSTAAINDNNDDNKPPVATAPEKSSTTSLKVTQQQKKDSRPTPTDAPTDQPATSDTMDTDDAALAFTTVKRKKDRTTAPVRSKSGGDRDSDSSSAEFLDEEIKKLNEKEAFNLGPDNFAKWLAFQGGAKKFKK